jgi:hypothetical protein
MIGIRILVGAWLYWVAAGMLAWGLARSIGVCVMLGLIVIVLSAGVWYISKRNRRNRLHKRHYKNLFRKNIKVTIN